MRVAVEELKGEGVGWGEEEREGVMVVLKLALGEVVWEGLMEALLSHLLLHWWLLWPPPTLWQ